MLNNYKYYSTNKIHDNIILSWLHQGCFDLTNLNYIFNYIINYILIYINYELLYINYQ